jgi:hypothetical protein
MLFALVVGGLVGASVRRVHHNPALAAQRRANEATVLTKLAPIAFRLTIVGYLLKLVFGVARGLNAHVLLGIVTLQSGALQEAKSALRPVAGITTLTQFASIAVACLTIEQMRTGDPKAKRRLIVLFVLAAVRTIVYAERLALIEVVLPFALATLLVRGTSLRRPRTPLRRMAVATIPLWAPALLFLSFSGFEYFRSWGTYYRDISQESFVSFNVNRLQGYYATPGNNSALALSDRAPQFDLPYYTARFFWDFPGVATAIPGGPGAEEARSAAWMDTLRLNANPEFNNEGSLLLPIADFGITFGAAFWLLIGFTLGRLYAQLKSSLAAVAGYAVLYIGLLELPRFIYWSLGRTFPTLLALLFIAARVRSLRMPRAAQPLEVAL